ncbi:MAG: hypothetical protein WCS03_15450 [Bacteroidota bacterium]
MNSNQKLPALNFHPDVMKPNRFFIVIVFILLCNTAFNQQVKILSTLGIKGFRAAVVKIDITPEDSQMLLGYQARRSTGIHDHIPSFLV